MSLAQVEGPCDMINAILVLFKVMSKLLTRIRDLVRLIAFTGLTPACEVWFFADFLEYLEL